MPASSIMATMPSARFFVVLVVDVVEQRHLHVGPAHHVRRMVQEPVAVGVLEPGRREMRIRALEAVGIEDRAVLVAIGRAEIEFARIPRGERAFDEALAQPHAVERLRHAHTEIRVPVELADRPRPKSG
jgi:hypothetical protein